MSHSQLWRSLNAKLLFPLEELRGEVLEVAQVCLGHLQQLFVLGMFLGVGIPRLQSDNVRFLVIN